MDQKLSARCRRRAYRSIFAVTLAILCFPLIGFGQEDVSAGYTAAALPDPVMRQVVRRILVWSFKPRSRPAVIHLSAKGVKEEWLPSIKNIQFKLLSEDEVQRRADQGVYFFRKTSLRKKTKTYEIGFGFGDPQCESDGTGWFFRVSGNKVRTWPITGWGFGCSIAAVPKGKTISNS